MIRKNEHTEELEVLCDLCEAEMHPEAPMYEYEEEKWCCKECLETIFPVCIAQDFIDDHERAEILGDNLIDDYYVTVKNE